ncbi:MAG: hypothetical protein DME20_08475 [Verrucomicrobia bacterium]|nr:MAG: hypothetical protein DME20_08475 [Verrucomicrobiota bacterium]
MPRESARGCAGAPQKSQFSTMAKASNRCCLAMFSIIWAMHLRNCIVKKSYKRYKPKMAPLQCFNDLTLQQFNIAQR